MFVNLPYSHVLVRVLQSDVSSCHEVFFLFCLKSIIVAVASVFSFREECNKSHCSVVLNVYVPFLFHVNNYISTLPSTMLKIYTCCIVAGRMWLFLAVVLISFEGNALPPALDTG